MEIEQKEVIAKFYEAFKQRDAKTMLSCYHEDIVFHDPAFGELDYRGVGKMWTYLLEKGDKDMKIDYVVLDEHRANWEAQYLFSSTKRKVHNKIEASFEFRDGKIVKHTDHFDFWKWSRMALGLPGYLLGWSPYLRNKVRRSVANIVK